MVRFISLLPLFAPIALVASTIPYSVRIEGVEDEKTLKDLRNSSQLMILRKKPPNSLNSLKFRAESDVPELIKILHAHGYLEAEIEVQFQKQQDEYFVILWVNPGPLYTIKQYHITLFAQGQEIENPCAPLCLADLGIAIGEPLKTTEVLKSELAALRILSQYGYPLAEIMDREIIADGKTKQVRVDLKIELGPIAYFGPTAIEGNCSVHSCIIDQQIQWCENDRFNSCLVEATQEALMDTGLFSSVYITYPNENDGNPILPMKIEVTETKHKSISAGVSYQTTFGPGATIGWENRNVRGLGRKFTFQANIAQRVHSGILAYQIPHFHGIDHNYTIQAEAAHESIKPYRMQSYSLLNRFDRPAGCYFYFSVAAELEYLIVRGSVDNGNFLLAEAPIHLRWTNVEDFLNPVSGVRFDYWGVPTVNLKKASEFYYSQVFTFRSYLPILRNEGLVLAQKLTVGTIFSNGLDSVPVPKRFFGGSEEDLRGYRYYTVSPLRKRDKPIGGRSAIFYTVEPRIRYKCFGLVPFFDIGNVYLKEWPTFKGKWRKSVGIGFRYFSFIGPLRLDVAFPIDRREGIDPHWWVFVSLGQSF
ncbi:MAG: BamA/TamA family outer membrane protein [Verrucomicrobia bacterium]|nr:BamA/TamA family outer membrane protein [Verrucomicrobiota bacterium]